MIRLLVLVVCGFTVFILCEIVCKNVFFFCADTIDMCKAFKRKR